MGQIPRSTERILVMEILPNCIQHIRGFLKCYALYKTTFYLLAYLLKLKLPTGWLDNEMIYLSHK